MTPLQIKLLVHFVTCYSDYDGEEGGSLAWESTIDYFLREGLLVKRDDPTPIGESYYLSTAKAQFYLDHLCSIPLPVRAFKIPEAPSE